ncbi:MAG TPA: HU family DNA-binding protein [Gemmatales bacterium]|nr:HU family DNA-binding protein [Gemmatales bacterium]HMP58579.1 HU family DNA-binding protein [Gemmatales bacterium]
MAEKPATKTAILKGLADKTGMAKKDVATFMDALGDMIRHHLGKKGPGVFTIPGLVKLKTVKKAATKERQGRNPKTGEMITIAAKPARKVVKAYPLKVLKDSVLGS